jgi:hypothetical protein
MKCQNGIDYEECENDSINQKGGLCHDCEELAYDLAMETRGFTPCEND